MAEATIPVDLRNPGQVFACLGLMEAAEQLADRDALAREPVEGAYAWDEDATRAQFTLSAPGEGDPVRRVVEFLSQAKAQALNAPLRRGGVNLEAEWGVETVRFNMNDEEAFPFNPPDKPPTLPVQLTSEGRSILISHWGDDAAVMGRDNLKFWAGAQGKPGAAFAADALALVREADERELARATSDPFQLSAPMSGSFRFDWRRDYIPLDTGFSLNAHKGRPTAVTIIGFPIVELLAAIGLQNARPERVNKLAYRYAVADTSLPTIFARAVLGGADLGFNVRRFSMQLGYPGREGDARCIIDSREDYA